MLPYSRHFVNAAKVVLVTVLSVTIDSFYDINTYTDIRSVWSTGYTHFLRWV